MSKLSIRSEEQLNNRRKNFREIVDILNSLEVNFFLEGGVMLGAIREKDFIKWDWDVEIAILSDEFESKFKLILDKLVEEKFNIINFNDNFYHQKINFYKIDNPDISSFSLFGWSFSKISKAYIRKDIKIPVKYIGVGEGINDLQEFNKEDFVDSLFN